MTGNARISAKRPRRAICYLGWNSHGRIIVRFLLLWGIYNLTLWQALCVREYIQQISSASEPAAQIPLALFLEGFVRKNGWMVLYAAAFSSLLLWDIASLTHRIVGPLKRAEEALYALINGKTVRQIEFREGDLIEDFEKAFNAYLAYLYGLSVESDAATSESKKAAPNCCEPPLGNQQMAALLHEFRTASATGDLMPARNSAD